MDLHIYPFGEIIIKGVKPEDLPRVEATACHLMDKCQEINITYEATNTINEEDDE